MSSHRHIDMICIAIALCAVLFTILFMNGERLGLTRVVDEDAEYHSKETDFTDNDLNGQWDTEGAVEITLSGDTAKVTGNGAYVNGSHVVITGAGKYVVTGSLTDGNISVDAYDSSKVFVMLDNVDINCSDDAAFRVERADKVFLTLKKGSANSFTSGDSYSKEALEDKTGGVIFSHDDLTINGTGSLDINAGYKHGMDVNDELVITGGVISITCPGDAMHVNDSIRICNADITVEADDDALHCDTEILVASGTILINKCYEGLEAPSIEVRGGDITVYPEDDGFNANGGFDYQKAFAEVRGGGQGGGTTGDSTDPGQPEGENASAGTDDSVPGPAMQITAEQDAAMQSIADQAAETWTEEKMPCITVSGGTITVINPNGRDSDGLDSNGNIFITGGDIRVSLNGDGMNNAIDFGSEGGGVCSISGGTVIACGGYSMIEEFDSGSSQCSAMYNFTDAAEAGSLFALNDSDGNILLSWEVPASYTSVNVSCPEMKLGETYTLSLGGREEEITIEEVSASYGDAAAIGGHMGGGGMGPGGMRGGDGSGNAGGSMRPGAGGSQGNDTGAAAGSDPQTAGSETPTEKNAPADSGETGTDQNFRGGGPGGGFSGKEGDPGGGHFGQGGGPGGGPMQRGGQGGLTDSETSQTVDTRISLWDLSTKQKYALLGSVIVIAASVLFAVLYRRRRG